MFRIGVIFGMEDTFPPALVDRINRQRPGEVTAEFVSVGAVRIDEPARYRVIVDRISHDIPFYRAYLKNAVLAGTTVINNPFWWSADDKFFNYALAERLDVAIPPTVLLPHKHHPPGTTERSMRNLQYPIDWERVFDYGWKDVYRINSPQELFAAYDNSGDKCMTLQRAVNFREYFRCYVVGQDQVRIMPYDPRAPFHDRYIRTPPEYDAALLARVERDAVVLCHALGYDLNTVEFAVEGGVPYAIDFMNPAPDADVHSVGEANFDWIVEAMAALAIRKALEPPGRTAHYRWDTLLNPPDPAPRA